MATRRKKPVAKHAAVAKNIDAGLAKIAAATAATDHAVTARTRDAKRSLGLVKRLAKRKKSLTNRKRVAAARAKKNPTKDTRAALRTVTRDLAKTNKELAAARAARKANSAELTLLRGTQRRLRSYNRALAAADKALAKKKKR